MASEYCPLGQKVLSAAKRGQKFVHLTKDESLRQATKKGKKRKAIVHIDEEAKLADETTQETATIYDQPQVDVKVISEHPPDEQIKKEIDVNQFRFSRNQTTENE